MKYDPALRLGRTAPSSPEEQLAERVHLLLSTPLGTLPWAPRYGVDLRGVLGRSVRAEALDELRYRVATAISHWVPEVEVRAVDARLVEQDALSRDRRDVPFAERAMASRSISAVVEVDVVVATPSGVVHLETTLQGD